MTTQHPVVTPDNPIPGYYKYRRNKDAPWEPCALWKPDPNGPMVCRVGTKQASRMEDPMRIWTWVADKRVGREEFFIAYNTGLWPSDPPPQAAKIVAPAQRATLSEPPPLKGGHTKPESLEPYIRGPGDNSGDLADFHRMEAEALTSVLQLASVLRTSPLFREARAALEADANDAVAYFAANPIKTKADADKCENWRGRIMAAASKLEAQRKVEKAPFQQAADEIDQRFFPVIRGAKAQASQLESMGQAWVRAEDARRLKEAQEDARKQLEEEQAAALRERNALAEQLGEPLAAPQPIETPVVVVERTLIGTGSRRKGAKAEKATAAIVDLKACAIYYAEQQHPALIELLQKLADKAAGAKAQVPGCVMSWQKQAAE